MSFTSRTDRKPDPSVDRERALAALIFCARQHPEQSLGQTIVNAVGRAGVLSDGLFYLADARLAAAFRNYSKENR